MFRRITILLATPLLVLAMAGCSEPTDLNEGEGTVLIDVRTPEEYAMGHLEGAQLLDLNSGEFAAALPQLSPDAQYLLYCRSGNRSGQAKEMMEKAGFKVDVQAMDWQTLITRRASQKPLAEGGWSIFVSYSAVANTMDPLRSHVIPAGGKKAWFGWPDVPEVETLRVKFAHTSDEAERKKITDQIQKLVIDEGIIDPLGQFVSITAYNKRLSGILEASLPIFWNIKKADK